MKRATRTSSAIAALVAGTLCLSPQTRAQSDGATLPFPPVPSASTAGPTLKESKHVRRAEPDHLRKDAPNVLIVLLDDVGFGVAETFGGEVATPNLTRLANEGLSYNSFHTTSICSPTRAALLTGRNHQRVGSGTIAERAVDWDGYTGVMPKTSATVAEVLHQYGYRTSAFGKWHNTPATETNAMGPFDRWPTGYGFDYFYGFLAGETSQYEPRLFENRNAVEPPHDPKYHLTEDLTDKALRWLRNHRSMSPDKPFLMYWAPGAAHGPHHVAKEWADKYKGKFGSGWDVYRERTFARQKQRGIIPPDTRLTPRDPTMVAWDSIPAAERPFQERLMEIYAGFLEHTDNQIGKLVDGIEQLGLRDNTIIFYIVGDNGSSAEGQNGSISELLAQNQIPNTIQQQIETLNGIGGLDVLGTAKVDNMYHAGWAWAGSTPFRSTKLVAAHFGGTRNPLVISWPKGVKHDAAMRSQFHHVNDIAPTIYDIVGITPPKVVNGLKQDPIDGVSMKYTFASAIAPTRKKTQYFENNGSRGIYHDGWYASTFGPLYPWLTVSPGLAIWDADKDVWQLNNLGSDFSQADDLSAQEPKRLAELKKLFMSEAKKNKVFPVGAGLWLRLHPEDRIKVPYTRWTFDQTTIRLPEFAAPPIGTASNRITVDADIRENASGVLYALGGVAGGLTLYVDKGRLVYEYNMMMIERYIGRSAESVAPGKRRIVVDTTIPKPGAASVVSITVDGKDTIKVDLKRSVPAAFSASETLDVGTDLGSPVSLDYFDRRPFRFDGTITKMDVELK